MTRDDLTDNLLASSTKHNIVIDNSKAKEDLNDDSNAIKVDKDDNSEYKHLLLTKMKKLSNQIMIV